MNIFEMGVNDWVNYIIFDNPVAKTTKNIVAGQILKSSPQTVTIISEPTPLWKLAQQQGPYVRIAGLMGASAVAIGAYGAHKPYPKDRIDELKAIFETGNRFHFIHSLALLGIPLTKYPIISGTLLITGTTLFSGICYYHAFTGNKKFSRFAPVGGTILIFAWLSMMF